MSPSSSRRSRTEVFVPGGRLVTHSVTCGAAPIEAAAPVNSDPFVGVTGVITDPPRSSPALGLLAEGGLLVTYTAAD